jgi:H+/Cl- antiporter ClcA
LQIGGGLGTAISKFLKLNEGETRLMTMCGMSAVFSAVFGTPLTAAVFSIEVASVGVISSTAVLPCTLLPDRRLYCRAPGRHGGNIRRTGDPEHELL